MRTGGFELGSSARTSSTLKWMHRIQCGFKAMKSDNKMIDKDKLEIELEIVKMNKNMHRPSHHYENGRNQHSKT
jgi:hypothetical protein